MYEIVRTKKWRSKMTIENKKTNQKFDQSKLDSFATKSMKIRYLDSRGITRGEISKILNIRYQHVRNVLITPITKDVKFD